MASVTRPISPTSFAQAIEDLPVENLYSKAHEIENSIAHLRRSNVLLQEYSDSLKDDASIEQNVRSDGDRDCLEAIHENDVVIQRQLDRIGLLKAEVERRGGRWHEADPEVAVLQNGLTNGDGAQVVASAPSRPRLTDEELRRRLEQQMENDGDDEEEGMHL